METLFTSVLPSRNQRRYKVQEGENCSENIIVDQGLKNTKFGHWGFY